LEIAMESPPLNRRVVLGLGAVTLAAGSAEAGVSAAVPGGMAGSDAPPDPTETVLLWPGDPPGMNSHVTVTEAITERSTVTAYHDRFIQGVRDPRLIVFRAARPGGAAMLVIPGGGYTREVVDIEGYETGRYLSAHGVTCFVLRYRLPGDGWSAGPATVLQDAQRAVRLIRLSAGGYGVDPARIGVMGFSAGGNLAGLLMTQFGRQAYTAVDGVDSISARPDFAALVYPVITMFDPYAHKGSRDSLLGADQSEARKTLYSPDRNVGADTPPCFITNCADDPVVPPENSLMMAAALRAHKVPVEQHMFEIGGHGHGIRKAAGKPVSAWPELFLNWGAAHGYFPNHAIAV
jgi:acetyl esterase/lipase